MTFPLDLSYQSGKITVRLLVEELDEARLLLLILLWLLQAEQSFLHEVLGLPLVLLTVVGVDAN